MKKLIIIANMLISLFIISCGALPKKEVALAKTELEKAKTNQAPNYAEQKYSTAEDAYKKAENFLKKEKKEGALSQSLLSIENSRTAILDAKERWANEKIAEAQNKINNLKSSKLNGSLKASEDIVKKIQTDLDFFKKIKPAYDLLSEAKNHFSKGKGLQKGVSDQAKKTELLKGLDLYIQEMDSAYSKAEKALALIKEEEDKLTASVQAELDKLNKLKQYEEMLTEGSKMVEALNKDVFANKFYKNKKDKVVADYLVLKQAILDKDLEKADANKESYDRLKTFFKDLEREKIALNARSQQITQKMLSKITGFYKKDAESYLERARRLKKEVERLYGKESKEQSFLNEKMQEMKLSYYAQNKAEKTAEQKAKEKEATDPHKATDPEEAMFRQLNNLYSDAKNLYEKEEYKDSVEKAKESIELAKRMIALKKAAMNKKNEPGKNNNSGGYEISKYTKYKVRKSDCLWKISMRKSVFGKAYLWPLVWMANKEKVKNPHLIYPGMILKIPVFK